MGQIEDGRRGYGGIDEVEILKRDDELFHQNIGGPLLVP